MEYDKNVSYPHNYLKPELRPKIEPYAGVIVSVAARRSILVCGNGAARRGRWSSL